MFDLDLALGFVVEFRPNNSGGRYHITEAHFSVLEAYGWSIVRDPRDPQELDGYYAYKSFPTLDQGIEEWCEATGLDVHAMACDCCGPNCMFRLYKDGEEIECTYYNSKRSQLYIRTWSNKATRRIKLA